MSWPSTLRECTRCRKRLLRQNTALAYVNVLETVEERLREMRELPRTRPHAAFRDLVTALEELGVASGLDELEEEFQKRSPTISRHAIMLVLYSRRRSITCHMGLSLGKDAPDLSSWR